MRNKLNEEEQRKIFDSVNGLIKLRRNRALHISQSISKENADGDKKTGENSSTDNNIIISKDFYEKRESSDDESVKSVDRLVREMSDNSEDDYSAEESMETNRSSDGDCLLKYYDNNNMNCDKPRGHGNGRENDNNCQTITQSTNENDECVIINRKDDENKAENEAATVIVEKPFEKHANEAIIETARCIKNDLFIRRDDNDPKSSNEILCYFNTDLQVSNGGNENSDKETRNNLPNNDDDNDSLHDTSENQISEDTTIRLRIEKTSRILCGNRSNNNISEIISFVPNANHENDLSDATEPSPNKIQDIPPVRLARKKPYVKEIMTEKNEAKGYINESANNATKTATNCNENEFNSDKVATDKRVMDLISYGNKNSYKDIKNTLIKDCTNNDGEKNQGDIKNHDMIIEKHGSAAAADANTSSYSVQIEETSQILCGKKLGTLEIISFIPNTDDDEIGLSLTKPDRNKTENIIPIQLPWKKPNAKEEFHIKERFD